MIRITFSVLDYQRFDRKQIRAAMAKASKTVAKELKNTVNRHGSGQRYTKRGARSSKGASAPGQPPARQTGELWRSIKGRASKRGYALVVSALAPHSHLLELGTQRMEQRPYFDPTFADQAKAIEDILREAVGRGLVVTAGRPDQPPKSTEMG